MKSIYYFIIWCCKDSWDGLKNLVRSKMFHGAVIWAIGGAMFGHLMGDLFVESAGKESDFGIDLSIFLLYLTFWTIIGRWKKFREHQAKMLETLKEQNA